MNKKVAISLALLIILLVGGYLIRKGKLAPPGSVVPQEEASSSTSLKDLISKGLAQKCTYENENGKGTVYVSDGKVRGDFSTILNDKTTISHMIVNEKTSYFWSDDEKSGIKMTFDTSEATPVPGEETPVTGSFDAGASMNYNCSAWIVDSSLFEIPTDIQFMSFGSNPPADAMEGPKSEDVSSKCSYCDNLTGDSKTQCLTSLNCN